MDRDQPQQEVIRKINKEMAEASGRYRGYQLTEGEGLVICNQPAGVLAADLLYIQTSDGVTTEISPAYRDNGDDADVFGVLPELVPWDDSGVVDQPQAEDQQAQQLHQHGGLQHSAASLRPSWCR